MSTAVKRGLVALFALAVLLGGAGALGGVLGYKAALAAQASQQRQAAQQKAAQQQQSEAFERKLCTTLSRLAALMPPAASSSDLSRMYLVRQHDVLAELGPDVGCKENPR